MDERELIEKIKAWGKNKGINNADKQLIKLLEESGELASEICRGRYQSAEVEDALGDIGVVWIILADILGYDVIKCLELAYNEISHRKGITSQGMFIKAV